MANNIEDFNYQLQNMVSLDLEEDPTYEHDLGMTLDQEKRLEKGLPIKVHRPTKVFGVAPPGREVTKEDLAAEKEAASIPQPPPQVVVQQDPRVITYEVALKQIKELATMYQQEDDKALAMFARSIMAVVRGVMPDENFTNPQAGENENSNG